MSIVIPLRVLKMKGDHVKHDFYNKCVQAGKVTNDSLEISIEAYDGCKPKRPKPEPKVLTASKCCGGKPI